MTGDEKWINYDNPKRRKSWVKPGHVSIWSTKSNIHGFKRLLCISRAQLGVVYYKLLIPKETVTGDRYRIQLMRLNRALKKKRLLYEQKYDKVILQHNNARIHVAKPVKTCLETLKWEVLLHSPYSPDLAPLILLNSSKNNDYSELTFEFNPSFAPLKCTRAGEWGNHNWSHVTG